MKEEERFYVIVPGSCRPWWNIIRHGARKAMGSKPSTLGVVEHMRVRMGHRLQDITTIVLAVRNSRELVKSGMNWCIKQFSEMSVPDNQTGDVAYHGLRGPQPRLSICAGKGLDSHLGGSVVKSRVEACSWASRTLLGFARRSGSHPGDDETTNDRCFGVVCCNLSTCPPRSKGL